MMCDCYTPNPDYEPDFGPGTSDWHAVYTIQLGELIEGGIRLPAGVVGRPGFQDLQL